MVQTDLSQISAECAEWRHELRTHREALQQAQKNLETLCRSLLTKPQLLQVEHFHNQFHIQLINIHDLKHAIKAHERQLQLELSFSENPTDRAINRHEELFASYTNMQTVLDDLRSEFEAFSSGVR